MTDTSHPFPRTVVPPALSRNELVLAGMMLLIAATTFLLPTVFSVAIFFRDKFDGALTPTITPLYTAYSFIMGSEVGFIREFWTALPALVVGIFAARPQTREFALNCVAILMLVVGLLGSFTLHFPPSEIVLREVAVVIGGPYEEHLQIMKHIPNSISLTRAIAVTYLTTIAAKVLTQKANR